MNNGIVTDDETIANSFNDYFVNVGKSLAHNIVSNVDPLSYVERSNECITDIVITVDDVKSIVSQLNDSGAGYDDLPPSIMKQLCTEYCVLLTYILNLSITQGDFPEELKLAKVLPKEDLFHFSGMRLGFGKNSGKCYVAINPCPPQYRSQ